MMRTIFRRTFVLWLMLMSGAAWAFPGPPVVPIPPIPPGSGDTQGGGSRGGGHHR